MVICGAIAMTPTVLPDLLSAGNRMPTAWDALRLPGAIAAVAAESAFHYGSTWTYVIDHSVNFAIYWVFLYVSYRAARRVVRGTGGSW
jgi:hypothetical protein